MWRFTRNMHCKYVHNFHQCMHGTFYKFVFPSMLLHVQHRIPSVLNNLSEPNSKLFSVALKCLSLFDRK